MTEYECTVDSFKSQDYYVDEPILEALRAGQEAIELLYCLRHKLVWSDSGTMYEKIDSLLKEWD
jgi:hypothetical protein